MTFEKMLSKTLDALSAEQEKSAKLTAALEMIFDLGSDGEHSGDRHARCRDIARIALAKA